MLYNYPSKIYTLTFVKGGLGTVDFVELNLLFPPLFCDQFFVGFLAFGVVAPQEAEVYSFGDFCD